MTFFRQMYIAHLVRRTIKTVNALQVRIFQTRNRGCPVSSVGNHQHGTRSKQGGQFRIASSSTCQLDGLATFTRATAIKVRSQTDHRSSSCKTVVQNGKQHRLRSSAGTTVHADACRIYIFTICQHIIQYQQSVHSLNGVRITGMVRFRTYLQSGFSPTIQVIIHTNSPHTRQCSHTLLLVLPVASLSKMAIGANNKCMFTFGTRCINRTANIKPRQGLQCKILHGISIEFPYFRENRLCILHCSFQHIIQSQTLAHFLSEYLPALFPLIFISIQATKI